MSLKHDGPWPEVVRVEGGFYGCESGCEVVTAYDADGSELAWRFWSWTLDEATTDEELRGTLGIPETTRIERGPTLDEKIAEAGR